MTEKLSRKIFQPSTLTNMLMEGACGSNNINLSDFINITITEFYTPIDKTLKKEMMFIFDRIRNCESISEKELQAILSRCVESLKDHPISDVRPLEQIFIHFTNPLRTVLRYDYIRIVNVLQDEKLHRLNDILKTIDRDFILGTREFGERSRYIFKHWKHLCRYSEIYTALATLIDCENIYSSLTVFRVIDLIKWLDTVILSSDLTVINSPFETDISLEDRYYGIRYEVSVYQTDNGYCALSGDLEFERMSSEINEYYNKYNTLRIPYSTITEEDILKIQELEKEGRFLFRRLSNNHN